MPEANPFSPTQSVASSIDAETPAATSTGEAPLVSVLMVTYNHERFIAQAIESVLAQQTTFRYELVIGEDCSTDGTGSIVQSYARRHPDRIRAFLRERNVGCVGPERNLLLTLDECRGRFVAWLDGDDYWIAPDKLQRQVDCLEANPDCVQCFHAVQTIVQGSGPPARQWITRPTRSYHRLQDHIRGSFILPCSVMFRRGLLRKLPEWYFRLWTDDWPLFMLHAQFGRTAYQDEVMAVYRIHDGGWWQRLDRIERQLRSLEVYDGFTTHFNGAYEGIIRAGRAECHFALAIAYEQAGELRRAADNAWRAILLRPRHGWQSAAHLARVMLRFRLPRLYEHARRVRRMIGSDRRRLPARFEATVRPEAPVPETGVDA